MNNMQIQGYILRKILRWGGGIKRGEKKGRKLHNKGVKAANLHTKNYSQISRGGGGWKYIIFTPVQIILKLLDIHGRKYETRKC